MIQQFHVENYKALRDVTLNLTPLHLLIGPNDSGKTSLLEAIGALCRSVDEPLENAFAGLWEGNSLVWREDSSFVKLTASVSNVPPQSFQYQLVARFGISGRNVKVEQERFHSTAPYSFPTNKSRSLTVVAELARDSASEDRFREDALKIHRALSGVSSYRWNPAMLKLPVAADAKRRFKMDQSGFGLAQFLDDLLGEDRQRFEALEMRLREIFPQVASIKLRPEKAFRTQPQDPRQLPLLSEGADGKGIYFQFAEGEILSAGQVSDGLMLVLAYLAVLYSPQPPRVLLIEEPENGIHPKRLGDILNILRELVSEQEHTQLICTTHSPYVVDHFEPQEVTLCVRNEEGSIAVRRLSEVPEVQRESAVFSLGEIWSSADDASFVLPPAAVDSTP